MSGSTYIEYSFKVSPRQPASDILLAELAEVGFESFVENEEGLLAYIQQSKWFKEILTHIQILKKGLFEIQYEYKEIAQQNWNASWESNFEPIMIADTCRVRAPFHEKKEVEYDIVIMPKMSFGTGHHETTHMMLQHILDHEFKGKTVLDMGSGTGVLAILAAKRGATVIDAIDVDHWCYLNAKENVARNDCHHINVYEGDVKLLQEQQYDSILANINRNVLLRDIPLYAKYLKPDGLLFLSGFYEDDIELLTKKCQKEGLNLQTKAKRDDWISLVFQNSKLRRSDV